MSTLSRFRINQASLGTYGIARRDILPTTVAGVPVELEAENAGLTYQWEVIQTPGSTVPLVNATSQVCTFAPEMEGGYIVKLTVNEGLPNRSVDRLYLGIGMNVQGVRYALPALTETVEDNSIGHPEYGWLEKLVAVLKASAGVAWSGSTILRNTPLEIFLDGVDGSRFQVPSDDIYMCVLRFRAYGTNNPDGGPTFTRVKFWELRCAVYRDTVSRAVALVDVPVVTVLGQTGGVTEDWDIDAAVEVADDTLRLSVTGDALSIITWEAVTQ